MTGRYERTRHGDGEVAAFVPVLLPPIPRLRQTTARESFSETAEQSLARLELAGEIFPSVEWLIYALVRKEAVVSFQIEGTS